MKFDKSALLCLTVVIEFAAAQSLPPCAVCQAFGLMKQVHILTRIKQTCVGKTKARCKPTDYACACLDRTYITKLTNCIEQSCDEAETHDANWYLSSLCNAVGAPLRGLISSEGSPAPTPKQIQLELRNNLPIKERQIDASFSPFLPTATITIRSTQSTNNVPSTGTASSVTDRNNSRGGEEGGLSTQAKVGIGVGVPIGVILNVGAILLAFWFGRKSKKGKVIVAASSQQPNLSGQPQMMVQPGGTPQVQQQSEKPYSSAQNGPAELSQSAQYIGHEMPTKGNTIEMPANYTPGSHSIPPQGPSPLPGYIAPQQGCPQPQPQQHYFPPPQQPTILSAVPVGQVQYPTPGQQWPQPNSGPVELPERRKTPNMYE